MTLVFNELSAERHARTRSEAMQRMSDLVKAIATLAGRSAVNLMPAIPFDFFGMKLSENYSLGTWLQDPSVDRDERLFLRTISTKVTFDRDVGEAIKERFLLSDFRVRGLEARALGLSYLLGTVTVSLRFEEFWTTVRVPLQYRWLEPDESQHCMDIVALNISDHTQVKTIADELLIWKRDRLAADPQFLVDRFRECFPHVRFGLDVETQLSALPKDMLQPTIGKLIVLDGAVRDWRRSSTTLPAFPKVHRESEPTMQRYGTMRRFRNADGEVVTYEPHAMVGSRYRIHLRVDQPRKSLEIGYIGEHLPTVTVPK